MRQKRLKLRHTHVPGVTFVMKQDVPANPLDILCFSPDTVMLHPKTITHLIEKLRRLRGNRCLVSHYISTLANGIKMLEAYFNFYTPERVEVDTVQGVY